MMSEIMVDPGLRPEASKLIIAEVRQGLRRGRRQQHSSKRMPLITATRHLLAISEGRRRRTTLFSGTMALCSKLAHEAIAKAEDAEP